MREEGGGGKGEWRKRKKGRGQCWHEPYIHIIIF